MTRSLDFYGFHSQGAWRLDLAEHYQDQPHLVGAYIVTDEVMVAEVRGAVMIDGVVCPSNMDNATLLVAAPALRSALISQVECTVRMAKRLGFRDDEISTFTAQAMNALAKAVGEKEPFS